MALSRQPFNLSDSSPVNVQGCGRVEGPRRAEENSQQEKQAREQSFKLAAELILAGSAHDRQVPTRIHIKSRLHLTISASDSLGCCHGRLMLLRPALQQLQHREKLRVVRLRLLRASS